MKNFLLATAGFAALAVSVPASAQGVGDILRQGIESILGGGSNASRGNTIEPQLIDLNTRIQTGYQRGEISQSAATGLQNELRTIAQREQAYRSGGISRAEHDDLQQRLRTVEGRIQQASYNGNRNDRDGRYDRDGRWSDNDRRGGRNGCPPGLERKNNGCQPPGQAKKGDHYSNQYGRVPASYGQRYRDTQRYLYRYNDGRIYQIDRRTNRVASVTNAPRR
jgi:opacity protein-like surface antigen